MFLAAYLGTKAHVVGYIAPCRGGEERREGYGERMEGAGGRGRGGSGGKKGEEGERGVSRGESPKGGF